jgi:cytochrome c oxidase assembly protein subunit 15
VQFDHRMMAYALWLAAILHAIDAARSTRGRLSAYALALAGVITIQASLGILTLLYQAPLALALAHQAMALVVLTIATLHAQRLEARRAGDGIAGPTPAPR